MARTADARAGLVRVSGLAAAELEALWERLRGLSAEHVRDALIELLPALGEKYSDAAAALAAAWYEAQREAVGARGSFAPVLAENPGTARWEALAVWGVDPLFKPEPRPADVLTLISGGLSRSVANAHRETVALSSVADPAAKGWRRVTRAGACDVCRALAGRGEVYSGKTVHFRAHDHCLCAASPEWNPGMIDISHARDKFVHSTRFKSDEARVKNARALADWASN